MARKHLGVAAQRQKYHHDAKSTLHCYKQGDLVWYFHPTGQQKITPKLRRHYEGPVLILKRINDINYVIQMTSERGRAYCCDVATCDWKGERYMVEHFARSHASLETATFVCITCQEGFGTLPSVQRHSKQKKHMSKVPHSSGDVIVCRNNQEEILGNFVILSQSQSDVLWAEQHDKAKAKISEALNSWESGGNSDLLEQALREVGIMTQYEPVSPINSPVKSEVVPTPLTGIVSEVPDDSGCMEETGSLCTVENSSVNDFMNCDIVVQGSTQGICGRDGYRTIASHQQ